MRWFLALLAIASLVCFLPSTFVGQDAPKADADHHQIDFENDQVRVVRYIIPPHEKTALHEHPKNVQVLLTDHNAKVTTPDGKTAEIHGKAGQVAWRNPTTHVVENIGAEPIRGILVEPKNPGGASLAVVKDVAKVDPQHTKVEFENDQVRVLRYRYAPGESSAIHDHPDNVQIMLTDTHGRSTAPDGKTSEVTGKTGDTKWRTATSHAVANTGDQPFEGILVELKGPAKSATAAK